MEQDNNWHFFKRMKVAIFNLEDYGKFLGEHGFKAVKYFLLLILLFSCIYGISNTYFVNKGISKMINYMTNELPNFTFADNTLKMENKVEAYDEEYKLRLFIDTDPNITNEIINKYKSKINLNEFGFILLEKEAIIIYKSDKKNITSFNDLIDLFKNQKSETEIELLRNSYESINEGQDVSYNSKDEFINVIVENNNNVFITIINYITITITTFLFKLFSSIGDLIVIAILGYLVALYCRIRFKWQAPAILAVYSLSLPIALSAIYSVIYRFTGFEIRYFDSMYWLISYVYIIAAIFMIKSDIIRDATELQKIYEEQEKIKKEQEELDEKTDTEKQDKEKEKDKDKEEKGKSDNNNDESPEESPNVNNREPDGFEI